jgi:hypothetical protein
VAAGALLVAAWPTAARWLSHPPSPAWVAQADALSLQFAGPLRAQASQQQLQVISVGLAVAPIYLNPLRNVSDLVPERIDQGVDFSGSGPVYALGNAVIIDAGPNGGWPGGGWITYQLTDGPDAGLVVYVAEDVTSTVVTGQHVSPSTVIGEMFEGGDGIETGWAQSGANAESESQAPEAGGIGGGGPFPTLVGASFDKLLQSLGVPAAPNAGQFAYGLLPANYPPAG